MTLKNETKTHLNYLRDALEAIIAVSALGKSS
jgi:hypothetical protein